MTIAVIAPTASRGLDRAAAVTAATRGTCRRGGIGGLGGVAGRGSSGRPPVW